MSAYTEVTSTSWISRLGGAFKGILLGLLLFIGSFALLGWNEYRSVKEYKGLKQMEAQTVALSGPIYDADNDGLPVCFTGMAETAEVLRDPMFGISGNVLKMRRIVEMYQWEETSSTTTRKKLGGGEETVTTYEYRLVWSERAINSSGFKEQSDPATGQYRSNPPMQYSSESFTAGAVNVGDFTLNDKLKGKLSGYEQLNVETVPPGLPGSTQIRDGGFYIPVSLTGSMSQPQVGDYRIRFEVVRPSTVTVVAVQNSNHSLSPFMEDFQLLSMGEHTAAGMFEQAQSARAMMTWILRAVGVLMMFFGLSLIFRPLSVVMDVIPILGNITGGAINIVCFILALVLSLVTIGLCWLAVRPLLGGTVLALAAGAFVLLFVVRKGKKGEAAPAAPTAPPPPPSE